MRTTSSIESLNSVIQRKFPKNKNIYSFIESLRLEDAIKTSDFYQILAGNISNQQLQKRRLSDQYRGEKIQFQRQIPTNKNIDRNISKPRGHKMQKTEAEKSPNFSLKLFKFTN